MEDMILWTDKYKPKNSDGIIAQKKALEQTREWLGKWKKGRALLFYGPPGVGKSLIPEVLASEGNMELMQLNASEKRNTEQIERFLHTARTRSLFSRGKFILLDEIDGISGQDRGAVSSIIKLIKNSDYPVFLVANDPYSAKLRPLRAYAELVKFSRIPVPSVAKRLREICEKEGIKAEPDVLKNLARWSQGDLRSAITDLQMVCQGEKEISPKNLEILGFREREAGVFEIMPAIFRSGSINAARNMIKTADKDPDEIFLWIEANIQYEFREPEEIAEAYDILSKADIFRGIVSRQQNWRFKGYMIDIMSGVSLAGNGERHGWVKYQSPQKLFILGSTKAKRAAMESLCRKIGSVLHCSSRKAKEAYVPYLKILMKKQKGLAEGLGLEPEEIEIIRKF